MTKPNKTVAAINAAIAMLHDAGAKAADAGRKVSEANESRATAVDTAIAALSTPGLLEMPIVFDVTDRAGQVVEHCKESVLSFLAGFKNPDGSDYRAKQTAFRSIALPVLFGVPGDQSAGSKAVWAMAKASAFPTASALVREGMAAKLVDNKLVVEGGAGEAADKLREAAAKSTSALAKVAAGKAGTSRAAPQNDNGAIPELSPSEIAAKAAKLARAIAKGDETLCNAALSCLREIAKLVEANPEAFAED